MKTNRIVTLLTASLIAVSQLSAQPGPKHAPMTVDNWEVNVRPMDYDMRQAITGTMSELKGSADDRGLIADIGQAVGFGLVSSAVDIVVTETFNLATYRKRQKAEWMRMIEAENNYTDSINSVKGLKDFYAEPSRLGALDPSDINFDGIEIRGIRNGAEVIYLSCSIDRSRLDNLFRHSKFNLVVDTLAFYPYQCHLPNVTANGIRIMNEIKRGRSQVVGDSIIRPGKGGNGFSFDERSNLNVGIDLELTSSWINEAVQVHRDINLGGFKMNISIPDNVTAYTYSRRARMAEAEEIADLTQRDLFMANNLIQIEGDCFVVPRSYMPLDNGTRMWGTGEYNIKVKVRESCRFNSQSDKARYWRDDYKMLRQMQNHSGEVQEYFRTLWSQNGTKILKSSYKTAINTTLTNAGLIQDPQAAMMKGMGAAMGAMGGASKAAGQQPAQGQAVQQGAPVPAPPTK